MPTDWELSTPPAPSETTGLHSTFVCSTSFSRSTLQLGRLTGEAHLDFCLGEEWGVLLGVDWAEAGCFSSLVISPLCSFSFCPDR